MDIMRVQHRAHSAHVRHVNNRPGSGQSSRGNSASQHSRRQWARGVGLGHVPLADKGARTVRQRRPVTAPGRTPGPSGSVALPPAVGGQAAEPPLPQLHRPNSAHSRAMTELFAGTHHRNHQSDGGKVSASMLVASLTTFSNEHSAEQLLAMRRCMMLCDPKPSVELAAENCRSLAGAGAIPVLVKLLSCGAVQLEWGAVLCLGSIAAFDNSTNASNKHLIRQHGGLGDFVAMLWHSSKGVQKLAACAIANMAHDAWPQYGTMMESIAAEVRMSRCNGLGGFERLLQMLRGKPDDVSEWAAAALCNLSLCDADSRAHIARCGGVKILVELLERVAPSEDVVTLARAAPAYADQRLVPSVQDTKLGELASSTLCNMAADDESNASSIGAAAGLQVLGRLLYSAAGTLVEGALHTLRNMGRVSPRIAAAICANIDAIPRTCYCMVGGAPESTHGVSLRL